VKNHKLAFNLEKESKIINPHKMEMATTTNAVHNGEKGEKAKQKHPEVLKMKKPVQESSCYAAAFPNWDNGKQDIFHEKHPQYPYYAVPFRGESSYAKSFTGDKIKKLVQQTKRVEKDTKKLK